MVYGISIDFFAKSRKMAEVKMYLKKSTNRKTGRTYLSIADGYWDKNKGYTKTRASLVKLRLKCTGYPAVRYSL